MLETVSSQLVLFDNLISWSEHIFPVYLLYDTKTDSLYRSLKLHFCTCGSVTLALEFIRSIIFTTFDYLTH